MPQKLKVLFLATYPVDEPVTRFRIVQYFDYFKNNNIDPTFLPFMPKRLYLIKNEKGMLKLIEKIILFIKSTFKRLLSLTTVHKYDAIYISKEAFPFGPPILEKLIKKLNPNLIFDFDDAIFAYPIIKTEKKVIRPWRWIWKDKDKVPKTIEMSSLVVTGNDYLANYALRFNQNVKIIVTPINTRTYKPAPFKKNNDLIIGWIGSWWNVRYLNIVKDVLERLSLKYRFVLKIVGPKNIYGIKFNNVNIVYKLWSLIEEIKDLQSFDIGIMPLLDTDWERGKCGFKIIQYMAMGIPSVASLVGVNKVIIEEGINGFLAKNNDDWMKRLSLLIEDSKLRYRLGKNARIIAEKHYSTDAIAPKLINLLKTSIGCAP